MKRLVLDRQAIRQNLSTVRERAGQAVVYAVLTGDAHGAGLVDLAKLLREDGVSRFAVAEPKDAAALRKAGLTDEEILFLRSTVSRAELEPLIDLNAVLSVGSTEAGMAVNALADERSTVVEVHLRVDCGAGFGGFPAEDLETICAVYRNLPNVAISGVYTCLSGQNPRAAQAELALFTALLEQIRAAGFETGLVHAAGSSALMRLPGAVLDAVRVGSALLGRRTGDGLHRAAFGEAAIDEISWLPKGHKVGRVTLRRPARLAILPIGYQNGFGVQPPLGGGLLAWLTAWRRHRRLSVRINGQRVKVIGAVGAIETVVKVTSIKCAPGDLATFDLDPLLARGFAREYR